MGILQLVVLFFVISVGTAVLGLLATWIDRKVTARVQYRVGPPWYQSFMDFLKLMGKETIIPSAAHKRVFLLAPLVGLVGITLVSFILWQMNMYPAKTFLGDLIVVLYLSILPSIALIIGGSASGNPLASLGASREMKLLLAYELPFLLAIFISSLCVLLHEPLFYVL